MRATQEFFLRASSYEPRVTGLALLPSWLGYRAQQPIVTDCVFFLQNVMENFYTWPWQAKSLFVDLIDLYYCKIRKQGNAITGIENVFSKHKICMQP